MQTVLATFTAYATGRLSDASLIILITYMDKTHTYTRHICILNINHLYYI